MLEGIDEERGGIRRCEAPRRLGHREEFGRIAEDFQHDFGEMVAGGLARSLSDTAAFASVKICALKV